MTEVSVLPAPFPEDENQQGSAEILAPSQFAATDEGRRISRLFAHIREELIGPEAKPSRKELMATFGVLGAVAVTSTIDQLWLHSALHSSPWPVRFYEESGRHFAVGLAGAVAASTNRRLNNLAGMVLGATAADLAVEASESLILSVVIHERWENVGNFASRRQVIWQNAQDYLGAILPAVGLRTRLWWLERKSQKITDKI